MDLSKNEELKNELSRVAQKYGLVEASDTPDFIVIEFIINTLKSFNKATKERDKWYRISKEYREERICEAMFGTIEERMEFVRSLHEDH